MGNIFTEHWETFSPYSRAALRQAKPFLTTTLGTHTQDMYDTLGTNKSPPLPYSILPTYPTKKKKSLSFSKTYFAFHSSKSSIPVPFGCSVTK